MSSDPQLDTAGIGQRQFTTARRGYDADEVRNYLRELAGWVGGLQRREAEARERADQAEARARKAEQLDEHRLVEILGEETARVLDAARAAATDIRTKAEESAARLISEANQEAHRLKAEGEAALATQRLELLGQVEGLRDEAATELDRKRAEGAQIVSEMRREAQSECDTMRQDGERKRAEAETQADEIRAQAREEGRQLVAEAQLVRSRVLGDLARRRHTAREQLERLHAARERLLAAYEVVRRTVDEATAELTVVLPEAKIASDTAMRRVGSEPEPSVEQLENMVAMARITGLIDEATDPVFGDDGYGPADAADVDVDVLVVGTAGGVGVYDVETEAVMPAEPDDHDLDLGRERDDHDLEPVVEVEVGVREPDASFADDEPFVDDELEGEIHGEADGLDEPDEGELDQVDGELVDDLYLDELDDLHGEAGGHETAGDDRRWVAHDEPRGSSAVDELFARLKAGRGDRPPPPVDVEVEAHEEVGYDDAYGSYEDAGDEHPDDEGSAAAGDYDFASEVVALAGPRHDGADERREHTEVAEPHSAHTHADEGDDEGGPGEDGGSAFDDMDPDEALLRLRDDTLASVEHDLGRKLKRVLADEQNEVLDLLRRTKASSLDELMPDGAGAHAARYSEAALEGLVAAAAWGAELVEGEPKGSCQPLAEQLGRTVVDPLRERMARSFTDAGGDVEEVTNRLRALYREWKGHHIAAAVQHYAMAAYSQGAYSAVPQGEPVRWLVDRSGDPCPDADDYALAGRVCKGEGFPTGDLHPPAHLGCRCMVVPLGRPRRS